MNANGFSTHPGNETRSVSLSALTRPSSSFFKHSFAKDDQTAGAPCHKKGESLDESGIVFLVFQSSRRENDRRAAVQKPGMVRTLRHLDMEMRCDHGIVYSCDAAFSEPW